MWEDKRQAGLEEKRLMLSCAWTKADKYSVIILQSTIKMTNTEPDIGGGGRTGGKHKYKSSHGRHMTTVALCVFVLM